MSGDTLVLNSSGLPISVIPISSFIWQDAVKAIWVNSVSVLDYYEDWIVHSPTMEMRVPAVVMTRRYINEGRAVRFTRENIFLRDGYRCQYCGNIFGENSLTLDHVRPVTYGGKSTWDNLSSACSPCNSNRGCNMKIKPITPPYQPTYYEMVERRRQFPIEVPDGSWLQYLEWPEENVILKPHVKKKMKLG